MQTMSISKPLRKLDHSASNVIKKDLGIPVFQMKKEESDLDLSLDDSENDITLLDVSASSLHAGNKLSKQEICEVIRGAHHDLLYSSANSAYVKIWEELHRVK
jgi:hypothetical protein